MSYNFLAPERLNKTKACVCGKDKTELVLNTARFRLNCIFMLILVPVFLYLLWSEPIPDWGLGPQIAGAIVAAELLGIITFMFIYMLRGHKIKCAARRGVMVMSSFASKS